MGDTILPDKQKGKRKMIQKRIVVFFYGLTPTVLWLGMQLILSAGYGIVLFLLREMAEISPWMDFLRKLLEEEGLYILMTIVNLAFCIGGFFWYSYLLNHEGGYYPQRQRRKLGWAGCLNAAAMGIVAQVVIGILLAVFLTLFPGVMENYAKVMESLGVGNPTVWTLIYGVIAAPVAEELIYRGLTMKILERAFPFWFANLIQAGMFGLMHMNLVQSTYAFLLGLILGAAVKKYGTLKGAVICHFAVNVSGNFLGYLPFPMASRLLLLAVSAGILLFLHPGKSRDEKNTF